MVRSVFGKVMWVGRATVFLVGLAVILALVLGVATMALAAVPGDPFKLGQVNRINNALTTLIGSNNGAMLAIDNDSTATGARALDLRVEPDRTPMRVNSQKKVTNLNADKVDNLEGTQMLGPRGYAHITLAGNIDPAYPSQGIESVLGPSATGASNLYCFDLTFNTPMAAVGSPYITNAGIVAMVTRGTPLNDALKSCPDDHEDAAVKTYGSDGSAATFNYQIIFV